jgi:hypothetical protein
MEFSGVRFRVSGAYIESTETSYETSVAGTANHTDDVIKRQLNVEHPTSNIERPMLMALCFIHFKVFSDYEELG